MHSVLIVIQKPPENVEYTELQKWQNAVGQLGELANTYGAIETLSESVLLIHLSKGMLPLALTLHVCIRSKVSYKVLFFEEAPRWVPSSDDISIRDYPDEHKL